MSSSSIKLHTQIVKREEKNALRENEAMSTITIYSLETDALKIKLRQLENEFNIEESQYRLVAEDKKEKRLKAGVNIATAGRHEANIEIATTKRDKKIEVAEKQNADHLKELTRELKEATARIIVIKEEIENLPDTLKNSIEGINAVAQTTLNYFQPLVDRCYEEVQAIVNYPPTHFKKQAMIQEMKVSIETRIHNLLIMKASEYDPTERLTQKDIDRQKMRDQVRAEDAAQQKEAEARQYDIECEQAKIRQAENAADEARAQARQAERENQIRDANSTSDPDAPLPPIESLPRKIIKHQVKNIGVKSF